MERECITPDYKKIFVNSYFIYYIITMHMYNNYNMSIMYVL